MLGFNVVLVFYIIYHFGVQLTIFLQILLILFGELPCVCFFCDYFLALVDD